MIQKYQHEEQNLGQHIMAHGIKSQVLEKNCTKVDIFNTSNK